MDETRKRVIVKLQGLKFIITRKSCHQGGVTLVMTMVPIFIHQTGREWESALFQSQNLIPSGERSLWRPEEMYSLIESEKGTKSKEHKHSSSGSIWRLRTLQQSGSVGIRKGVPIVYSEPKQSTGGGRTKGLGQCESDEASSIPNLSASLQMLCCKQLVKPEATIVLAPALKPGA